MKSFLIKSSILSIVILTLHFGLAQLADGYSDPYYIKVASPKQTSLIVGASRANVGIMPSILDSVFNAHHLKTNFFNYAFANTVSPYGNAYYKAIVEKIDKKNKTGMFILSVLPMTISSLPNNPNDVENFRENKLALANISHFNGRPNYDYLLNGYEYGWGNIILKKIENNMFNYLQKNKKIKKGVWTYVHKDGWFEMKYFFSDSAFFKKRTEQEIEKLINSKTNKYKFSEVRYNYLAKTINYLKNYGNVYIVRMPVHQKIIEYENKQMPNFDSLMHQLAKENNVSYLNFTTLPQKYLYRDGNHFRKVSAIKFSINLANKILNHLKR